MPDHFEIRISNKMGNILLGAGKIIIQANYIIAFMQ